MVTGTGRLQWLAGIACLAVVFAACAAEEPASVESVAGVTTMAPMDMTDTTMGDGANGDHDETFIFGEPAEASPTARIVELITRDDFSYTPGTVTIQAGEVITFRVTNEGQIAHDFTLGDEALQDRHDLEMAEMAGMTMADEPNAFMIPPGETKELTWHFTVPGEYVIGCHVVGHYAAGMRASLTVEQ